MRSSVQTLSTYPTHWKCSLSLMTMRRRRMTKAEADKGERGHELLPSYCCSHVVLNTKSKPACWGENYQ